MSQATSEAKPVSDLLKILVINKNKELKKLCRSAVVQNTDLVDVILACQMGSMPWLHKMRRQEFQPDHLQISKEENAVFRKQPVGPVSKEANKVLNKIATMFKERRLLVGHLFVTPDLSNWHLFYFDQRDRSEHNNHWSEGSHIHLINHALWPHRDVETVWKEFCSGTLKLSGEHIRFIRNLREGGA